MLLLCANHTQHDGYRKHLFNHNSYLPLSHMQKQKTFYSSLNYRNRNVPIRQQSLQPPFSHFIFMMRRLVVLLTFLSTLSSRSRAEDRFNYVSTDGTDYGPEDWSEVRCNEVGECPGWPDGWELGIGWQLSENKCEWCPATGDHNCGLHRQSPIDLYRGPSTTGHNTEWYV